MGEPFSGMLLVGISYTPQDEHIAAQNPSPET